MGEMYPQLGQLLGGYFNQGWRDDAPDSAGIMQRYVKEWPKDELAEARSELEDFLKSKDSESNLSYSARELGCYYFPSADGLTYRQWFNSLVEALDEALR